ncbi:hypothetical protein C8J57DRAFT_1708378 [Mycena rebaudengoi]|nr:hypothetical protein C8J57DRAFT_1708378 [Mycena rebaudengoi]
MSSPDSEQVKGSISVPEDNVTIESLPNEILAQIFKAGTLLSTYPGWLPCLIVYSAVCRRWRAAALDHPDLWTIIQVSFFPRGVAPWVAMCLERSKACFFEITLHLDRDTSMSDVAAVMLLVVQHVHRLRKLFIKADSFVSNPDEVFALLQNAQRTPQLTVLELSFPNPHPSASMTVLHNGLIMQAPRLCSLRVHGVGSPVPFVGLRSLDIQGLRASYADFRDMVVASPLLAHLTLPKLRLLIDLESKRLPPIEMPSLTTLAISFSKPPPSNAFNPCHSLTSLLSLPNLEYLELAGASTPNLADCFQEPSTFTKLRTLRLVNVSIVSRMSRTEPERDISGYLRGLTTVEDLQLIHTVAEYFIPLGDGTRREMSRRRPRTRSINLGYNVGRRYGFPQPAPLGPIGVPSLLDARNPSTHQQPPLHSATIYPNLRSISLDTLLAGEVAWLCKLVLERPNLEEVRLSQVAQRHLVGIKLVDGVIQETLDLHGRMDPIGFPQLDGNGEDVDRILRERVRVRELDIEGYFQSDGGVVEVLGLQYE